MDSRIKDLGKDQRIALARIVYDLIMADKIIDDEEVVKFAKLFALRFTLKVTVFSSIRHRN